MNPSDLSDACETHSPGDFPITLPYQVLETASGSLEASYRCSCGREWKCWWDAESAGWPARKVEAA